MIDIRTDCSLQAKKKKMLSKMYEYNVYVNEEKSK